MHGHISRGCAMACLHSQIYKCAVQAAEELHELLFCASNEGLTQQCNLQLCSTEGALCRRRRSSSRMCRIGCRSC